MTRQVKLTRDVKKKIQASHPRPPNLELGYGLQVNLVRPVRQPKRPSPGEHPRQRGVVAHAERAVNLNRRVDDRDGRRRRRNLTRRDGAFCGFVPFRVEPPRGVEGGEPGAVEGDARAAERLQDARVPRQGLRTNGGKGRGVRIEK